jgi:hypothetical protein
MLLKFTKEYLKKKKKIVESPMRERVIKNRVSF